MVRTSQRNNFGTFLGYVTYAVSMPNSGVRCQMQPFGLIIEISQPTSGPPGTPRFSNVSFRSLRSAAIARNVMHNYSFTMNGTRTELKTGYAQILQAHAFRNWIASHPRIALPIVVFLLGGLTYTVITEMTSPWSWILRR